MNKNANLILSENMCDLLFIWNLILNEYPPLRPFSSEDASPIDYTESDLIVSQDGKRPTATLKWNPHPQWEYWFWECMMEQIILQTPHTP